jgi:hypothetical protein
VNSATAPAPSSEPVVRTVKSRGFVGPGDDDCVLVG